VRNWHLLHHAVAAMSRWRT